MTVVASLLMLITGSSITDLLLRLAVHGIRSSLLQHHNSFLLLSVFLIVQDSQPYSTTGKTNAFTVLHFVVIVIYLSFHILFNPVIAALSNANRIKMSPSSNRVVSSAYLKLFICLPPILTHMYSFSRFASLMMRCTHSVRIFASWFAYSDLITCTIIVMFWYTDFFHHIPKRWAVNTYGTVYRRLSRFSLFIFN